MGWVSGEFIWRTGIKGQNLLEKDEKEEDLF